jgi:hypothetical protein
MAALSETNQLLPSLRIVIKLGNNINLSLFQVGHKYDSILQEYKKARNFIIHAGWPLDEEEYKTRVQNLGNL